jgi:hypothetical protein
MRHTTGTAAQFGIRWIGAYPPLCAYRDAPDEMTLTKRK